MSTLNSMPERYAVVTGANKGIGLEICRQLAASGIKVILTSRDEKRGLRAVESLEESGLSVIYHQLDVTDTESISCLAKFIETEYGRLDILVNNAGIGGVVVDWGTFMASIIDQDGNIKANAIELLMELTTQTYEMGEECSKTVYFGTKNVTEALVPLLLQSDSGRIVNVSATMGKLEYLTNETARKELEDIDGLNKERLDEMLHEFLQDFKGNKLEAKGWPVHLSAYKVSKAAVNAYTRLLAKQYPKLRVNSVCPGFVKTDGNANNGILTVDEGARGPVMLALIPDDGPSGCFFDRTNPSNF